jgi:hypothetical protein
MSQRDIWVDSRGAARRNVARDKGRKRQNGRDEGQGNGVHQSDVCAKKTMDAQLDDHSEDKPEREPFKHWTVT